MPGRTWRDLKDGSIPSSGKSPSLGGKSADAIAIASQNSPRLSRLLEQRQLLENQLNTLSQGGEEQLSPRDAAKFQVPTFAERQAQQRDWEQQRERLRAKSTEIRASNRRNDGNGRTSQSSSSNNIPAAANSSLSSIGGAKQWLTKRDSKRQSLHDAARDRLSPLHSTANAGRRFQSSLSSTSDQLRDLDRQLAKQGLGQERDELNSLGASKLTRATSMVDRYTKMAEAPMRAVKKMDQFWEKRQHEISGAMDRTGPYVDRSKRRLSTETGGSGNLFERMEQNRLDALKKRREQHRQEERDEARNERARRNRNKGD